VSLTSAAMFIGLAVLLDHYVWPQSSFVAGAIGFVALGLLILDVRSSDPESFRYAFHPTGASANIFWAPLLFLASFFFLCRGLWDRFGDRVFVFVGDATDLRWALYVVDNFVGTVTLGAPVIFDWSWSEIDHADNLLASSLIFAFRLTLTLGLIKTILLGVKIARSPYWKLHFP
jgi:hypothetical protein